MAKATDKKRANGHRSRKGTNGKPTTARHNDRDFDVSKAAHIDESLLQENEYWKLIDLQRAFPDAAIPQTATFDEYEHQIYEIFFGKALEVRNEKQIAAWHKNRVQTMEQFRRNAKMCPEESIWTIGNRDNRIEPEVLKECFLEFLEWHKQTFPNVLLLDAALHRDEPDAAPHFHLRQVWFHQTADADGNTYLEVHQGEALKAMGIERPEPDKKESRYNNAKVTYTAVLHEKWLDIAEAHGIEVERTPQEKEKSGLPLLKFKAQTLEKKIDEMERTVATLDAEIEEKQDLLPKLREAEKQLANLNAEYDAIQLQIDRKKLELTQIPPRPTEPTPPAPLPEKADRKARTAHKAAVKAYEKAYAEYVSEAAEWDSKYAATADQQGIAARQQREQARLDADRAAVNAREAEIKADAAELAKKKSDFKQQYREKVQQLKGASARMHTIAEAEVQRRMSPDTFPMRQREEDERYLQRHKAAFAVQLEQAQEQGKAEQQRTQEIFEKVKHKSTKKGDVDLW